MSRFQTIDDVWAFLDSIPMFGKVGTAAANFGLDNIRNFCEKLGNPQDRFPSIHIAGTNGKGTTAALFESVYRAAGFKTGLFTSPHLVRYNERVRINGEEIADEQILEFFRSAEPIIGRIPVTYFEWSTALAFWAFAKQKVDIAVIECGLGGRLDSTNIINPKLSVITSIGRDHEAVLGSALSEIAREKAGIIKQGVPVVLGDIFDEALNEITNIARNNKSECYLAQHLDPKWERGKVWLGSKRMLIETRFVEPVNRWNVAMVIQGVELLQEDFKVEHDRLVEAIEGFNGLPGRFERIHTKREWYFSGSHNQQAVLALMEGVNGLKSKNAVLILSMLKDKVTLPVLEPLQGFSTIYYYDQKTERAAGFSKIRPYLSAIEMDESAVKTILNELSSSVVIFAGSFYFYPIVKRWLSQID